MRMRTSVFVLFFGTMGIFAAIPQTLETTSGRISVPILIYHSIRPYRAADLGGVRKYVTTPQALDEEFAYLKENGYSSVNFDDLVQRLQSGTSLPPKPVIICFDDGPETQYTYALPLLKKYSYIATFFVFTNAIGRPNYLSWDQVLDLSAQGMQIGCHSRFHPYLTRISSEKTLWDEIAGAKERLEAHLGKPVTDVCVSIWPIQRPHCRAGEEGRLYLGKGHLPWNRSWPRRSVYSHWPDSDSKSKVTRHFSGRQP